MQLSPCATITDEKKFVENHEAMVEANPNNKTYLPYKERLELYYKIKKGK
jgi:hypothetical protein